MATGNVDVGNKTPTHETGQPILERRPIVERLFGRSGVPPGNSSTISQVNICGAMAQQCDSSGGGNQSSPQELIRLVGCREASARTVPATSPRSLKRPSRD